MGLFLDQAPDEIEKVTADGAYDGAPTYQIVEKRGKGITVMIPPPVTAVLINEAEQVPSHRDGHITPIAAYGRLDWQKKTAYGRRSLAETAMAGTRRSLVRGCVHVAWMVNARKRPSESEWRPSI